MFLANSLNEKLKRSFSEIEVDQGSIPISPPQGYNLQSTMLSYPTQGQGQTHKKNIHPAILTIHKHISDSTSDSFTGTKGKLDIVTKTDWEKKFTLPHLRAKWKESLQLNFNPNHKKFPDDLISPTAKIAKEYIKDLIDPDTLQVKNKRWNTSTNARDVPKPELKKTVFDVNHGLNNFPVTKIKQNQIEEGVDSRNYSIINGDKWNNSTILEKWEKKQLDKDGIDQGTMNTMRYWNKTQYARLNQEVMPISEERQKFEGERYYKRYKSPIKDTKERYDTMQKIKELTWIEREKVAKQILHNNPGSKEGSEKINSLIEKDMYNTYRTMFNEMTGRVKARDKDKDKDKDNRNNNKNMGMTMTMRKSNVKVDWKDDDIAERIKTITDWRDIKWFKPIMTNTEGNINVDTQVNDVDAKKKELLKPLVPKANIILKEEESIKDKLFQNYKQALKKDMLQKRNKAFSLDHAPMQNSLHSMSKYPIDEEEYNRILQRGDKEDKDKEGKASMTSIEAYKDNYLEQASTYYNDLGIASDEQSQQMETQYNTHYFLEAYKKVALQSVSKEKKDIQRMQRNKWIGYQYTHPGTYRAFEFEEKKYRESEYDKPSSTIEAFKAWSCCMNTIEESKGCRKIMINRYKWNLSNA